MPSHSFRRVAVFILAVASMWAVAVAARTLTATNLTVAASPRLLGRSTAGAGGIEEISIGSGLSLSGGTLINTGGGGGGVSDGDKGDITVTGSGATWTIDADVVTYAKMQNVAAVSVVGRASGTSGDAGDITAGADGQYLMRQGGALTWAQPDGADLSVGTVSYDKLAATIPQGRLLGRGASSGTGSPEIIQLGSDFSMSSTTLSLAVTNGTITNLSADHSNSTTTPTTIPTLSAVMVASSTYAVECLFVTSAAATTTGVQITTTVSGTTPTTLTGRRTYCTTATAVGNLLQNAVGALNATASAGTARCVESLNFIVLTAGGTATLGFQLDSEVATSNTTVHAGSHCRTRLIQ